jgi:putative ABC transport system permease protein
MPDWRPEIRARLKDVRLSPAREAEIVEELSQHLEDRYRSLIAAGQSPEAAEQLARAAFSDRRVLGESLAPLRQAHWTDPSPPAANRAFSFEGLAADLRQAIRALRGAPAFSIVSLLVLALGIGATTAIFSVVDAVVLRGLPFDQADRLVAVGERQVAAPTGAPAPKRPGSEFMAAPAFGAGDPEALSAVKPQNWLDWVVQQQVFESMTAIATADVTLLPQGGEPEDLSARRTTASFFDVFRIRPALGRAYTREEEEDGRDRVVIISHALWQRRFNGDPAIVGQSISLDDGVYDVIGVMGAEVTYPVGATRPADVWVPYVVPQAERTRGRSVAIYLHVVARLKDNVSIEQAQAQMTQVAAAIEQANPEWNRGNLISVRPLGDHLVGASIRSWMLMLLAAVALVLLIACTNVANLLLARATTREREVAVRAALGAGRWRLIRQLLVESLVLSIVGTALGVLLAWWGVAILRNAMPQNVPRAAMIAINWRVLLAAAGLALATGTAFGLVPALHASSPNLTGGLNLAARSGGASRGRQRLRRALLVTEVGLALVLVVGSTLFTISFIRVMRIDPGLEPTDLLTMQVFQRGVPGQPPANLSAAFEEFVSRLQQSPGVSGVAAASGIPLRINMHVSDFKWPADAPDRPKAVSIKTVTPGYHRTLGIHLEGGRFFDASDDVNNARVAIINAAAARQFFGSDNPISQRAFIHGSERTIVGVVGDAPQANLESKPLPEAYLPLAQSSLTSAFVVVRSQGDPYRVLPAARTTLSTILPTVPLRQIASMDEMIDGQTAQRRITMLMLGLFGVLGLVIAAVGVYGVMAYLVSQRTREIGVRMALGATRMNVMSMVVRQAGWLSGAGVAIGAAAAWYLTSTVQSFLFDLQADDLRAFVAAAVTLVVAALVASIVPARRAASVDPTVALRSE